MVLTLSFFFQVDFERENKKLHSNTKDLEQKEDSLKKEVKKLKDEINENLAKNEALKNRYDEELDELRQK